MKNLICLMTVVLALVTIGQQVDAPGGAAGPPAAHAATTALNSFDFAGGTLYPAQAQVRIADVAVSEGALAVNVAVSLDRPTPNTVAVRVTTRNGSSGTFGFEGRHFTKFDKWIFFRPGDPLVQTVQVSVRNMDVGRHFEVIFPSGVVGGVSADDRARITGVAGAPPTPARNDGFRKPRAFSATGKLVYSLDPARMKWSDGGTPAAWSTRLPHGRSQPGNAETGLYLDPATHPSPAPPIAIENGAVVLRSQQLASIIPHEGELWWHGAAVLTGEKMPATQVRYGQYEWEAMMPNRRGAWPALWLLPTSGWPPEIDVYEGFGNSPDFNFARHISANIHGGAAGQRSFVAPLRLDAQSAYGLSGFDTSYHRFAVDIAPDFITWFVDGKEVYQTVNAFPGTIWFPLMNVAVKHTGNYAGGTGEMRVRAFSVWKAPD